MIYLIVFLIILFCVLRYDYSVSGTIHNRSYHDAMKMSFLIFVLLAGLRYRVGTDTLSYMDEYYNGSRLLLKEKYLTGWYLFISLFRSLDMNFYFVQIALASFTNYAVFSFIKRYSNHWFSILILYYVVVYPVLNFEILRQGVCISLFLLSFHHLDNKEYIKYYIYIGIACFFHYSAFFLLILPLLSWIQVNKKSLSIFSFFILLSIVLSTVLKERIYEFSNYISVLQDKSFYYFSEVDINESFTPMAYITNLLLNVGIPFIVIRFNIYDHHINNTVIVVCLISMIVYIVSIYMPIIYRFNNYFQIFNLILFVDLFNRIRGLFPKKSFMVFTMCILLFVGVKSRVFFSIDEGVPVYYHYYPYSSIFNEYKVPQRERFNF